ncbi:hypothetical protein B4098_3002 [Heyndrickxia coagulans]|uniref:Uncharacterized protein n=1 Tax=Heyndrickxia coagulans TaxID=1398 RepID=A0A150JUN0_HEYCO|nr:hypothetical protein B4098_3002 [Heyndrickxia coagulans]
MACFFFALGIQVQASLCPERIKSPFIRPLRMPEKIDTYCNRDLS